MKIGGKARGRFAYLTLLAALILIGVASARDMFAQDMSGMDMHGDRPANSPNGMSGESMAMDAHMSMTTLRTQSQADVDRANYVLESCRRALMPYRNYHVALMQGFRIFLPQIPQPVYHFTDYAASSEEYRGHFDLAHPGSALYVKEGDDYVLVGAMYSAPPEYSQDQLNDLIPLSVAKWHQHVKICLPEGITLNDLLMGEVGAGHMGMPGMLPVANNPSAESINRKVGFMADGRFGFEGKIADAATCQAAGGHFIPLAFGWMVHVYPFNGDDLKVAFGMSVPKPLAN
jgi:hypothetical protein